MRWKQLAGSLAGVVLGSGSANAWAAPVPGYDMVAPQLTAVQVSPLVDMMQQDGRQVLVDLSTTDNQTGLVSIYLTFTGPVGANGLPTTAGAYRQLSVPAASWNGRVAWTPSDATVPGEWRLTKVRLIDRNGNSAEYDAAALTGLGGTTVTVRNASKDAVAPKLISGSILTEMLSQSARLPGSDGYYYGSTLFAQADLVVRDRVQSGYIQSGIARAELSFCNQANLARRCTDYYDQFTLTGTRDWRRTGQYTLNVYVRPFEGYRPLGVYELVTATVTDRSGNVTTLTSTAIGGETDFSTLFPTTTITLTP